MAFPGGQMFLNERDVATWKILTAAPKGFIGPPSRSDQLVTVTGRLGSVRVSQEGDTPPRRFTVEAALRADTAAEAETLWDSFVQFMGQDEMEVRFAAWPTKVGRARFENITPSWLEGAYQGQKFTMAFVMPDPLKYARQIDPYTIPSGSEVALVLGSAASDVRLKIAGTGATPIIRYKDAQGTTRGEVEFPVTLPAGEWIDYNPDGYQLARRYATNGAVVTDIAPTTETLTGHLFGSADPDDGDGTLGPTLQAVGCNVIAELRVAYK